MELNRIYNEDCLVGMKEIPDGTVDCVICDLPYGTTACAWDSIIPFDKLWEQYNRICKETTPILLFGSEPFSSYLRMSNILNYRYDWVWHKNTSGGFVSANTRPMKYHENISVFYKKQPVYNPQYQEYYESSKHRYKSGDFVNRDKQVSKSSNSIHGGTSLCGTAFDFDRGKYPESVIVMDGVPNSNGRIHPTQKPVELLRYLIRTYSNPGDVILDNCMGSGTTAVAAVMEKRKFIGFETDKAYYEKSNKRLRDLTGPFYLYGNIGV